VVGDCEVVGDCVVGDCEVGVWEVDCEIVAVEGCVEAGTAGKGKLTGVLPLHIVLPNP
jgi:hypothetical protein